MKKINLNKIYGDSVESLLDRVDVDVLKDTLKTSAKYSPAVLALGALPNTSFGNPVCNAGGDAPLVLNSASALIDLNNDGIDDVFVVGSAGRAFVSVNPYYGDEFIVSLNSGSSYYSAANLSCGYNIGPSVANSAPGNHFNSGFGTLASTFFGWGNFNVDTDGAVGFQFGDGVNTFYGYMEIEFTAGVGLTVSNYGYENAPGTAIAACDCEAVPTVGEWGLITLGLLLLSFGTVTLMKREGVVEMAGSNRSLSVDFSNPIFDRSRFFRALNWALGIGVSLSAFSLLYTGTITTVDIIGGAIAAPVLAYWLHLVMMYKSKNKES